LRILAGYKEKVLARELHSWNSLTSLTFELAYGSLIPRKVADGFAGQHRTTLCKD
jgi:hypothetical protein